MQSTAEDKTQSKGLQPGREGGTLLRAGLRACGAWMESRSSNSRWRPKQETERARLRWWTHGQTQHPLSKEAKHAWYPPGHSNRTKGTSNTSSGSQLKRPPEGKPHFISLGSGEQVSAAQPTQELSTGREGGGHWILPWFTAEPLKAADRCLRPLGVSQSSFCICLVAVSNFSCMRKCLTTS